MSQADFTRVVKVGGSLLDLAELGDRLTWWLATQPPGRNVLLAGGGPLADGVRQVDRVYSLRPKVSHRLAIDTLGITAKLLAALLPEASIIRGQKEFAGSDTPSGLLIADVAALFAEDHDGQWSKLPSTWEVTSDSLAANLARVIGADELVLLKSAPPPQHEHFSQLAAAGYVDRYFSIAANRLTVRFGSLR